ncbi:MAG: hypothetical protein IPL79_19220 [Myxococcales bacterium]|nr:hypothetical protein [Myxococcales bacterium]
MFDLRVACDDRASVGGRASGMGAPRSRAAGAWLALSVVGLTLGAATSVVADPVFARASARDLALGESLRAAAVGTMSPELNPSGVALTNELTVQVDYGYFKDAKGSAFRGAVCDSTTPIAGCVYYRYGAGDLPGELSHSAHTSGVTLAKRFGLASIGIAGKRIWYSGGNASGDFKALTMDAGITLAPTPVLAVAGYGYNLAGNNNLLQREVGGGLAIKPNDMFTLAGDARWNVDDHSGDGTFGGGAEVFLASSDKASGYALRGGMLHVQQESTTYFTGGIGFANLKMGIDLALRKATSGGEASTGEDLQVMISIRIYGPRGDASEGGGT